eukprot:3784462-Pyramimonas_sp.AAC.2
MALRMLASAGVEEVINIVSVWAVARSADQNCMRIQIVLSLVAAPVKVRISRHQVEKGKSSMSKGKG